LSLEDVFRSPRYAVVLGRAQDLMTYTSVEVVELVDADRAYFSGTLLSLADAPFIGGRFYAVTMPRFLDERRDPQWGQYAILPHSDKPPIYPPENAFNVGKPSFDLLVDTAEKHPYKPEIFRGVVWHSWI